MEDIYVGEEFETGGGGLTEKITKGRVIGRDLGRYDKRKFKHDRYKAQSVKDRVLWHVTKDDRLEAGDAGDLLHKIHINFGIGTEGAHVVEAFNDGLFFCHTLNSGSVLQPARSVVMLEIGRGKDGLPSYKEFNMMHVIATLGVDMRRFFRAYADDVRAVNRKVLDSYDPGNFESVEKQGWLMEVAFDRGLSRYPDLAHDSADKCLGLIPAERAALASSKVGVFGNIVNTADVIHSNSRLVTAGDSSAGVAERN